MTWEKIAGLVRHMLTIGAGYVVGAGVLPQAEADAAIGALMALAGIGWSLLAKTPKKEG
jgi:hypothetical protein